MSHHPPPGLIGSLPLLGACQLTVWGTGPGVFEARVVLPDGSLHNFSTAFELALLLRSQGWLPAPAPPGSSGLR